MRGPVLFFVEDPGAANWILDLPEALRQRSVDARVFAAGAGAAVLEDQLDAMPLPVGMTAADLVERERPSVVLVGTSENPETLGLALVDAARAREITTVGFVDAFPNACFRFRGTTDDPLAHCPDRVLVPDEWTRTAFCELGVAAERVIATGHPYYDRVLRRREELEHEGRHAVRSRVFPKVDQDARVLAFAAEISTGFDHEQFQRSSAYTLYGRGDRAGRTEIVLEELIDAVTALRRRAQRPIATVLRLHPKNTLSELLPLTDEFDEVSQGGSPLDVAFASDLLAGMTSTILIEGALLGRPTLSILPRAIERDWLPSIRAGIIPCAMTPEELRRALDAWVDAPQQSLSPFVEPGAIETIADLLSSLRTS